MTLRQQILKTIYPLFVFYKKIKGENKTVIQKNVKPPVSFYSLCTLLNNGKELQFEKLRGKKTIIINTASNCGYTSQYAELQQLYNQYKERVNIIAFPSNNFKEQEKGSDEEIAKFCELNFGVTFALAKKSEVRKGAGQNKVFEWLTHKELNGWNEQEPAWNFSKYLIDEEGKLTHCFDPAVLPLSQEVINAVDK